MPLRNAFVPISDIIQIPEKSSSDSCTKYNSRFAPLLVRNAANPRSCARHTTKTAAPGGLLQGTGCGGSYASVRRFLRFRAAQCLGEYCLRVKNHPQASSREPRLASTPAIQLVVPVFQAMTEWSFQAIHDALLHLAEAQGLKNGRIMWPVRVAVSGKATTPGGAVELCHILGKEETLRRVQQGIRQLTPQA